MVIRADLADKLSNIGLTSKEAQIYLALLTIGQGTAYQVAQHCEVKKPTVYVILEELRKKGLVLKVPHAKKALFAAADIGEYLHDKENKLSSVRSILPALHLLGQTPSPSVYSFSGIRGISQALDFKFDTMRSKTFSSFYSVYAAGNPEVLSLYREWDAKALSGDIGFKIITSREKRGYYRELQELQALSERVQVKVLENYDFPTTVSIETAESFVRIVDEQNVQATIVDNTTTAAAMRQIFELVWAK